MKYCISTVIYLTKIKLKENVDRCSAVKRLKNYLMVAGQASGNIFSRLLEPSDDERVFHIISYWINDEYLEDYFKSANFRLFSRVVASNCAEHSAVKTRLIYSNKNGIIPSL